MNDEFDGDTRTYFSTPEEGTRTVDRVFGHEGFPCPPTRGEVPSCAEAWERWQASSPLRLMRHEARRPGVVMPKETH